MGSSASTDPSSEQCLRQQSVLADLGERALVPDDLDRLFEDAAAAVVETVDADRCGVVESLAAEGAASVRAGVGWESPVGDDALSTAPETHLGTALRARRPVVAEVAGDGASSDPGLVADRDAGSAIGVAVGRPVAPWGVLCAYAPEPDRFTDQDAEFLRCVANVLGAAVETERARSDVEEVYGRISDAVFALDDDWQFTYLNDRARELIAPDGEELVGETIWEEFPDAEDREFRAQYERAMTEQVTVSFEEYYPEPMDAWFEVRAYPSESGLSVYLRDVTERRRAQQRLAEERDIFAQGPTIVFRWEAAEGWPVEHVSENVEDAFGYSPEELESGAVSYTDLLLDDEIDRIAREVDEATDDDTERFSHDPYRVRCKDGEVRWVKDVTKVIRNDRGEITHYLGYLVDITERKERERELSQYEAIVEAVEDGVYVVDDEGRFRMVNEAYAEMTGYDREELVGEHASLVVDEEVRDRARDAEAAMRDGESEGPVIEADVETASGERVPMEARFSLLPDGDGDSPRVGVVRDVSERVERERELRRTERRFEAIFEDPNILVGLLEPDGTVLDINRTAMEYIDADLESVTGEPFWETPWWGEGDDVQPDVREWVERAAAGEYVDFEADLTRPDGQRYVINGVFRPVTNADGEVVSIIVSDRDVTQRREYERRLEESERRYRTIADYFPNGIVTLFDHDLEYTLAAGQGFANLPVDPDDLEGNHFSAVWDEDTAAELEPVFEAALAGEERSVEFAYEGREWVVHGAAITDERGEVFAGMTMARDITERKEREQELAKYETIVETINDGIYVKDEDGHFTMVNEAYAELTGYDREELIGAHASLVVDEETMEQSRERHAGAAAESSEAGGGSSEPMEAPIQRADGGTVPAEGTFAELETDDGRESIGVVRDITERKEQRRRIEESERRYRTLVENFPDGAVGLFDEDLNYTAIGGELVEATGVDLEERIGNSVYDIYPDEVVEEVEPRFRAALAGETNSFEIELHDRHLFAHTLPVERDEGEVFAGMIVVQDVTERQEAERELRESEARFRMLAENVEEVVWMAGPDAEEFIYVNPAFEEIWGFDRERLYEEPLAFLDAVHPGDRDRIREAFETLPEERFDDEYRVVRPDGEVRWVHSHGARIHDEDAEMVRIVGTGQDVTERVERERELERALDLLERTEHIADVGGWEIDPETEDVFWTDHTFDLLEVEAEEEPPLEGALEMYHEEDRPMVEEALEDALNAGDAFDVEVRLRTAASDEVRWMRLQGEPEIVDGEVVSFRGAAQDVTERKHREQRLEELVEKLEESNERLEQFAYAASHDLQEPLRMVSSYLQLIERRYRDELDEDGEEFLDFAVDGADRMRDMIDGLLEYSRVDTRGDPLEPVDLDDVLADVREDLQVRIEESDADVTAESLPTVAADAGQLRQVFQNLLDNAIEYSGDDAPRVHVSAERRGGEWAISVRDEGVGFDPDDADRVFDVFQSLHGSGEHAGTGIGLALCERIVERHGGDIWVETEPGEGSTFTFTVPAKEGQ